MSEPDVTIVVVPRERFSYALASLQSVYANTTHPFSLVYVDAGSPARIGRRLQAESRRRSFRLLRSERYLSPNQARNLGLREARSEYVVFLDNDVLVSPGWLEALVRCAVETGAWVVGPLYLRGALEDERIHMAGGTLEVLEHEGRRVLFETHRFGGRRVPELPTPLRREPCDVVEFHAALVRTDTFGRLGPLDEELLNTREHVDLCLAVRRAGGGVWIEPAAVVAYVPPPPFAWSDVPFYLRRWNGRWTAASLRHFEAKWGVRIDPRHVTFLGRRRRLVFALARQMLVGGRRRGASVSVRGAR